MTLTARVCLKASHRIEYRVQRQEKFEARTRRAGPAYKAGCNPTESRCGNMGTADGLRLRWSAGVTMHATGTFNVKISPAEASALGQQAGLGRMTIDKTFAGDLEGTSRGEMLTGGAESTGAMAYVALERVTASVSGRSGSFLLMHTASMLKSTPASGMMQVVVVPQSGTDELAGLGGEMTITIAAGKHNYDFEYELQ
jgi:Protein of unknown function (DUF3224)